MPPRGDRVPVPRRCNNVLQVRQCAPFDHAMPTIPAPGGMEGTTVPSGPLVNVPKWLHGARHDGD